MEYFSLVNNGGYKTDGKTFIHYVDVKYFLLFHDGYIHSKGLGELYIPISIYYKNSRPEKEKSHY